ncbi:MAG: ComEC/Rec2 family competence protein [Patescibacteria group bacterium]
MEGNKIHKSTIFLLFLLAAIVGVALGNFWQASEFMCYTIFLASLALAFFVRQRKILVLIFLILAGLSFGVWRMNLTQAEIAPDKLAYFNDQDLEVLGWVNQNPDIRVDHTKLTIEATQVKVGDQLYNVSGKVLVKTNLYPEYNYGEQLKIYGTIQAPPEFEEFDYEKYLSRYGIYSVSYSPKIIKTGEDEGNRFYAGILKIKNRCIEVINTAMPEPQAGLFAAILLGSQRGMPQELLDQFSRTGTTHMIAISGSHIVIISAILMALLLGIGLRRQVAFVLATILLAIFILMVGAPASAVRSGIMGFAGLLAMNLGRTNKATNALLLSAVIMLVINPKILLSDIGFQLSFGAVIDLIYVSPILQSWLTKIPEFIGIKSALIMTLAAQVTTLPLILYYFGRLSVIAPLANIVVLPTFDFILVLGMLATLVGMVYIPLTKFIFLPIWLLLSYIIKAVQYLAQIPGASFDIKNFSSLFLILSYGVISYFIIYVWYLKRKYETI